MINNAVIEATDMFKSFSHPIIKMNRQSISNLEHLSNFQMSMMKACASITFNFMAGQLEAFSSLNDKVMEDTKELIGGLNAGYNKLFSESLAAVQDPIAQVFKPVAK